MLRDVVSLFVFNFSGGVSNVSSSLCWPVPILYLTMMWGHRSTLTDQGAMDREASNMFPTVGHIVFLIGAYKPEYFWFEVRFMSR
jgi:hypothetical protein